MYKLNHDRLMMALRAAYNDACRHKRGRGYVRQFEALREENLSALCDELLNRKYYPCSSQCFIISDPKKREVFAAEFRDRIVHHLYYNMVHEMFERRFIYDSYSCIKGRGTHFGIQRLEHHIRSASMNYTKSCYVMKLDIKGYFMHIDRNRLLNIALSDLRAMAYHKIKEGNGLMCWCDVVDMDFVEYLTKVFVLYDPLDNCNKRGNDMEWKGLPHDKSLFFSPKGCGLPIGNLTSQLFSNVYMNRLDQYVKRELCVKHYGRYVDDFFFVSNSKEELLRIMPLLRRFLHEILGLSLHEGKIMVCDVRQGVTFLGTYLKPWRRYIDNSSRHRMSKKITNIKVDGLMPYALQSRLNSYIGVLSHTRSYKIIKRIMLEHNDFWYLGDFVRVNNKWTFSVKLVLFYICSNLTNMSLLWIKHCASMVSIG